MNLLLLFFSLLIGCQGPREGRSAKPAAAYDQKALSEFYRRAASDDRVFERFRQDPLFNLMQENVSYEEGLRCLECVKSQFPLLWENLEALRSNDQLGSPRVYKYESVGEFSPTTLHYIALYGKIKGQIGDLEGKEVIQIGAGYGGLSRILHQMHTFERYTLVDIPAALLLAKRYLAASGIEGVEFVAIEELGEGLSGDIVISDASFFECSKASQKLLLDKIVVRAPSGFFFGRPLPKHAGVVPYGPQEIGKRLNRAGIHGTIEHEEGLPSLSSFNLFWKKS